MEKARQLVFPARRRQALAAKPVPEEEVQTLDIDVAERESWAGLLKLAKKTLIIIQAH